VYGRLVVEAKVVAGLLPIHKQQLKTHMTLAQVPVGLLIDFNVAVLRHGIKRVLLTSRERSFVSFALPDFDRPRRQRRLRFQARGFALAEHPLDERRRAGGGIPAQTEDVDQDVAPA
jgi:PD-(D/E)XK nuclease superfamily